MLSRVDPDKIRINTFFQCDKWATSGNFSPETMVPQMLELEEKWNATASFIQEFLRKKEANKRERQNLEAGFICLKNRIVFC